MKTRDLAFQLEYRWILDLPVHFMYVCSKLRRAVRWGITLSGPLPL